MLYSMTYTDHRERIEVMEFEALSDAEAVRAARHHLAIIREIFRRDHPRAVVRRGWYLLWIVSNVSTGATVYNRREARGRHN